jgi:hypothetical protein
MTRFIRIIPIDCSCEVSAASADRKIVANRDAGNHKVIGTRPAAFENKGRIDAPVMFVICSKQICSKQWRAPALPMGRMTMKLLTTKTFLTAAALGLLATAALAQATAPEPWELKPDMGYAYDKEGKTLSYKMGTSNAGLLLKGAKKVPKGTLFFIGQNGQLYIRTGPYLEGNGKFMFGSN